MFKGLINKFVGDRKSRLMKRLAPRVDEVKEWSESYTGLSDDDFPVKTAEFRAAK